MKKLFRFLLCLIVLSACPFLTAFAAQRVPISTNALPNADVSVTIRRNGSSIKAIAYVTANPLLTVSTTIQIQEEDDNVWKTVTTNTGALDVSTTTSAESDSLYRAYVICTIYDIAGNVIDTIYGYSTVLST